MGAKWVKNGIEYEVVSDFSASGSTCGMLNPPRNPDGTLIQTREAPPRQYTRPRYRSEKIHKKSVAGGALCGTPPGFIRFTTVRSKLTCKTCMKLSVKKNYHREGPWIAAKISRSTWMKRNKNNTIVHRKNRNGTLCGVSGEVMRTFATSKVTCKKCKDLIERFSRLVRNTRKCLQKWEEK